MTQPQPRSTTTGNAMADTRRRRVFADSDAVRVADLDALIIDEASDEPLTTPLRVVNGERQSVSQIEQLLRHTSTPWFREIVAYLEEVASTASSIGRPRQHTVADWVVFWLAAEIHGGVRRAHDELGDPVTWGRIHEEVAEQQPRSPEQRISAHPISRFQYSRFLDRYLGPDQLAVMGSISTANAVKTAVEVGLFDNAKGSRTRPDPGNCLTGDGTIINTMFNPPKRRADTETGEITHSRHDPDGRHHYDNKTHTSDGDAECDMCSRAPNKNRRKPSLDRRGSYEAVSAVVQSGERQGRVILDMRLTQDGETEASVFTDMVLDLRKSPEVEAGLQAVAYDMALHSVDTDRLLDEGIIVVNKLPLVKGKKIKRRAVRNQTLKLPDGTTTNTSVHFVNGTPCLKRFDADTEEWYLKLDRISTQINQQKAKKVIYTQWRVPRHPLAGDLADATLRIRHNSTKEERLSNNRRSLYSRPIPESDPCFDTLFGIRENAESNNENLKARLRNKRARSVGRIRNHLNLIAYQLIENDKTLFAHYLRTEDETRYAKHYRYRPPSRARPALTTA